MNGIEKTYPAEVALAKAFGREIVTVNGVVRFKANFAVRAFVDAGFDQNGAIVKAPMDLNRLAFLAAQQAEYPLEDMMKFYMDTGYSLAGFGEIFDQPRSCEYRLKGAAEPKDGDERGESPMDWMIKKLGIKIND